MGTPLSKPVGRVSRGVLIALAFVTWGAEPLAAQDTPEGAGGAASDTLGILTLDEVRYSVESTYPPLLAALIERDVREGRLRSARNIFDLDILA